MMLLDVVQLEMHPSKGSFVRSGKFDSHEWEGFVGSGDRRKDLRFLYYLEVFWFFWKPNSETYDFDLVERRVHLRSGY